jgi:hypothetical protein
MSNYALTIVGKIRPTSLKESEIFRYTATHTASEINVGQQITKHIFACWAQYGEFDILDLHYTAQELT